MADLRRVREDPEETEPETEVDNRVDGESKREPEFEHPEGGWGWVVVLASLCSIGSVFGIHTTFGILFLSIMQEFGIEDDENLRVRTALVGSLAMGMTYFCSPIVSVFTDMFGCRITAMGGAAVGYVGLIASSFVRSLDDLYFTYGVLFGCGCSFAYQPSFIILRHYFNKRFGLVNGVVMAGSCIFTVSLPPLLSYLLPHVGMRNTLRILAALMFVVLVLVGFTYKPLLPQRAESTMASLRRICNIQIWRSPSYWLWILGFSTALYGYFVPYVHLMKHVEERFGTDADGKVLLMCLGGMSCVGRFILGCVADYVPGVYKVFLQAAYVLLFGVMSALIPVCDVFDNLIAVCVLMGLFDGSIVAPITLELVGAENVSQAIGYMLCMMSFPMVSGPFIAGVIRDRLGSYDVAFYLTVIPPLIGGIMLCVIPWVEQRRN